MHIVFWTRLSLARDAVLARLATDPALRVTNCPTLAECIAVLPEADGLVLYNCRPDDARALMEAIARRAGRLRWMHFLTAGTEGFDGLAMPPQVQVTQVAGASAPVVAEHAMALLLMLARCLPGVLERHGQHRWDRSVAKRAWSLEGSTLAIVGYGQIGRQVAMRARAFGMRTIAVSRRGEADEFVDQAQPLSSLSAVLGASDAVVLAIAQTPETHHLFDAEALACCKPGAVLVNVARGALIDQAALIEALRSGRLGGAALDVTDPEPPAADDPLWDCPNLIVSPHVATEGSPCTEARLADATLALAQRLRTAGALSPTEPA